MIPFLPRKPAGAAALVLLILALAGCGRRGALEPPPGADLTSSSNVPAAPSLDAAGSEGGGTGATTLPPAQPATAKPKAPTTKPILKSFFLDPYVD